MRNTALASAVALAMMGASFATADELPGRAEWTRPVAQAGFVLTEAHIARLKSALNLTPMQARHWPAVEAALRNIVRLQAEARSARGFLDFRSRHQHEHALSMSRLMAAAMPLIRTLDDGQKREALKLAQAMGLRGVPASF